MVTGTACDDSPREHVLGDVSHFVVCPAQLEAENWLEVFSFEQNLRVKGGRNSWEKEFEPESLVSHLVSYCLAEFLCFLQGGLDLEKKLPRLGMPMGLIMGGLHRTF